MMLLKNSSHKSRWFNERTSQGMKKPINVGSASKLSGLKQQQQQEAQTGTGKCSVRRIMAGSSSINNSAQPHVRFAAAATNIIDANHLSHFSHFSANRTIK